MSGSAPVCGADAAGERVESLGVPLEPLDLEREARALPLRSPAAHHSGAVAALLATHTSVWQLAGACAALRARALVSIHLSPSERRARAALATAHPPRTRRCMKRAPPRMHLI